MRNSRVKRYTPPSRLRELVVRAGGKEREQAVADAEANVQTLRTSSAEGAAAAVRELGEILGGAHDGGPWERRALSLTDRIVTLSSHFGFDRLGFVADELAGLILDTSDRGGVPADVGAVYLNALRLFLPDATALTDDQAKTVMAELSRVRGHLQR